MFGVELEEVLDALLELLAEVRLDLPSLFDPLLTSSVILSKYTRSDRKTSYVVGQYLWIRLK